MRFSDGAVVIELVPKGSLKQLDQVDSKEAQASVTRLQELDGYRDVSSG